MKFLAISLFVLASSQVSAVTCTKVSGPTRLGETTLTFTILAGEKYAHLSEQTCSLTCTRNKSAVYEMKAVPAEWGTSTWELEKISGNGPDTLTWETSMRIGRPCYAKVCPELNLRVQPFKGTLKHNDFVLCTTKGHL